MRKLVLGVLAALVCGILGACTKRFPQQFTNSPAVASANANGPTTIMVGTPLSSAGIRQGTTLRWPEVGVDPCNPRAGCTLQWALKKSGWPEEVQQAFLRIVREQAGREVTITRGWKGWMTWGSQTAKFHPNTLADFPQFEQASEWSFGYGDTEYVLIRVRRCQNWGGNTRALTPPQQTQPAVPLAACP